MFTNRHLLADTFPHEYIALNHDFEYTWVSDSTVLRLRRSRESMIGVKVHTLYPDATVYIQAFEQVMKTREPLKFEAEAKGWNSRLGLQVFPTSDGIEVFFEELNEARQAREDAQHLLELTRTLNAAVGLDAVVGEIFRFFSQDVHAIKLALFGEAQQGLAVHYATDIRTDTFKMDVAVPLADDGPLNTSFESGTLLVLGRLQFLERYPHLESVWDSDTQEIVTVPLQTGGQTLGAMQLHLGERGKFNILSQSRLTVIAAMCAAAIGRTRQYEEAQLKEARFRTLLEATNAVILELDSEFRVLEPVASWEAFTGQTFEEYRGVGYLNAVQADDRLQYQGTFVNAAATGRAFELRGRLRGWQGDDRDVVVQCVPIRNAQGGVSSWIGTVQDVTEQTRQRHWNQMTQEVLLKLNSAASSYDLYQIALGEVAEIAKAKSGVLFGLTYGDERLDVLSGYSVPDTQLQAFRKHLQGHGSLPPGLTKFSGPYWRQDSPFPGSLKGQTEPVLIIPLLAATTFVAQFALTFPEGVQPSAASLAFLEALQPQLAPIIQRAHLLRALELSEAQGQMILASLDEGIFLLNHNREVAATNPAFLKMFGLDSVPSGGNFLPLLKQVRDVNDQPVRPEHHPAARAFRDHVTVRNEVLHVTLHNDIQLWVSMNAYPLQRPDGQWEVVVSMADVTESVELRRLMELHAYQDELTGLANRRVFSQTFDEVVKAEMTASTALLLLDVDEFKAINDAYGHATGDDVLRVVAGRLRTLLPPRAVLTRLGGDEFCVILRDGGPEEATQLAQRIIQAAQQPTRANDLAVQVTVSLGVAVSGVQNTAPSELYRHADLALNHAKKQGSGQVALYTEELSTAYLRTHQIERRMRHALLHREFQLYYQPVIDLHDDSYCGFEALCRWHDEVLGWVSPAEFIPIAETTGLIHVLGLQLLEFALEQCRTWTQEWERPVHMNVNISAKQFIRLEFTEELLKILARSGVRPEQLTLEVTEAVVIHDLNEVIQQLSELRRVGLNIALDDFGTGFSSLAVLERLPVDVLKIDRAMVAGIHLTPRRLELLRAVLLIADRLGLTVVAEGVEEPEELAVLEEISCRRIQGYLISRPLPPSEMTKRWSKKIQ